jgi:predicted CXXCH cytochrome family protein
VDCHGSHEIVRPQQPRVGISQTCAKCHQGVFDAYIESVHGRGLTNGEAADVPVCTDCHRAHDIAGPSNQVWRLESPDACGRCHGDEALMRKYGISANVLQTYLADFHGMTTAVERVNPSADGRVGAVCTDCHGVHDITKTDEEGSRVIRANLEKTCQRCHPGAGANFPNAWMKHYEPTFANAPLVFGVRWAYLLFIPFMIGGLILQVLLHLWRVAVNR